MSCVERVVLVGRLVVDRARARLHPRAAERLLVGRLAHRGGHDRRPGHEQLRGPAHDHAEVRGDHPRRAQPRHRPERRRHHRHARQVRDRQLHAGDERHVRVAHLLERLDRAAAARPVHEPHQRQPQVVREPLGVDHLLPDGGVGRAAADGEVVALHDRRAALDLALPADHVGRGERAELAVLVVGRAARQRAGLVERARVEQPLDPLAHRPAARGVLARHPLLAAHLAGERLAAAQLLELGLPAHAAVASQACGRTGRAGSRARPPSTCDRRAGPS